MIALDLRVDLTARRRMPPIGMALALLGLGLTAWQGWQVASATQQLRLQQASLASMERPAPSSLPAFTADEIKRHEQIAAVALELATPWPRLLDLFEKHAPQGVTLSRFEPDAKSGRLELTGRASSMKAVAAYMLMLERDGRLSDVMLQRHSLLDGPGTRIEFTITALWGGAGVPPRPVPGSAT